MLERLVRAADAGLPFLTVKVGDDSGAVASVLYFTILDLCSALEGCAKNGRSIACPTLARQIIDAYVDLVNVVDVEGYVAQMELADAQSWAQLLEHASRGTNPYLRSFTESPYLADWRRKHAQQINEARRHSVRRKEAEERFRLAGMEDEYFTVWKLLSASMHNNLSVLRSRHHQVAGNRIGFRSSQFNTPYELSAVSHACDLLVGATDFIHERYGAADADVLAKVREPWQELRRRELDFRAVATAEGAAPI
jgi:hypothetical protein